MSYLARHLPTGRTAEAATTGALHDVLQGWFAGAPLDELAAVDELCLAIERGGDTARAQVRLALEVDEVMWM